MDCECTRTRPSFCTAHSAESYHKNLSSSTCFIASRVLREMPVVSAACWCANVHVCVVRERNGDYDELPFHDMSCTPVVYTSFPTTDWPCTSRGKAWVVFVGITVWAQVACLPGTVGFPSPVHTQHPSVDTSSKNTSPCFSILMPDERQVARGAGGEKRVNGKGSLSPSTAAPRSPDYR